MLSADGTGHYKKIKCLNDVKQLQEGLNSLCECCVNYDMILNFDKCA